MRGFYELCCSNRVVRVPRSRTYLPSRRLQPSWRCHNSVWPRAHLYGADAAAEHCLHGTLSQDNVCNRSGLYLLWIYHGYPRDVGVGAAGALPRWRVLHLSLGFCPSTIRAYGIGKESI